MPSSAMSSSAGALVVRGLQHHRRNELDAAAQCYVEALAAEPAHPDACNLLGVVAQQRGDFAVSVELIGRAIAASPAPHYYTNLANALNQLARPAEAEAAARAAVGLDPGSAGAWSNLGIAERAQGRLQAAAASFRTAVERQPGYADAWSNLGATLTDLGRLDEAQAALARALALKPAAADAWFNLGNVHLRRSDWTQAAEAFDRSLALRPGFADAHGNLAVAHQALGRADQALAARETAARLAPASAPHQHALGLALREHGRLGEAVQALERAAALAPGSTAIQVDLGNALHAAGMARADAASLPLLDRAAEAQRAALRLDPALVAAHYNLGVVLMDRGEFDEAIEAFEAALALNPDYAEALCNLGHCLSELRRFEPAIAACEQALAIKPDLAEAQSTLGNAYTGQNRLEEAEAAYRRAVALNPDLAGGHCNVGVTLFRRGMNDAALAAYDAALARQGDLADARWNRALVLLQRGDYAEGWAEYEWRLRRARRIRADSGRTQPVWTGAPLDGAGILLHAEQGQGDAIQCARFIPRVAERGGRVVLQTPPSLVRLLGALPGVAEAIADDASAPEVACRLPLFSLPRLFAPSLEALGGPARYLSADPAGVAAWGGRLDALAPERALRIGIVWSGNVTSEVELGRSIPLAAFAPLAGPGVQLISLQKGDGLDQLDRLPEGMRVLTLGPGYDAGDFAETAAVVDALDLVVTCDTAAAHLAGALGRPVWLAVNAVADWRWLEGRTDSPWYPSLRLYRQPRAGDWDAVFEAMARDLAALTPARGVPA